MLSRTPLSAATVIVAKASPTVVSVNPVNITYGTALANSQLSGTATTAWSASSGQIGWGS